jgi:hypothetical protein
MLRRDFSRGDLSFGDRFKLFESDLIGKVISGLYQQMNKVSVTVWTSFLNQAHEHTHTHIYAYLGTVPADEQGEFDCGSPP